MNYATLFSEEAEKLGDKMALWAPHQEPISFLQLRRMAACAQKLCQDAQLNPGDRVLLIDRPKVQLYATILGIQACGAQVLLIDPWIKTEQLQKILEEQKPKVFFMSLLGRFLALQSSEVRNIPIKIPFGHIHQDLRGSYFNPIQLSADSTALITPTFQLSHGSLIQQCQTFCKDIDSDTQGTDLCFFTRRVLANLMSGKSSVLFPQRWSKRALDWICALPPGLQPISLNCSPAFLKKIMEISHLSYLREIQISGAIADCQILEKAVLHWPNASIKYIYGTSQAGPIAWTEAQEALTKSIEKGYFQALFLGKPHFKIKTKISHDGLWVQDQLNSDLWLPTGDRIQVDPQGNWWYQGPVQISQEDFQLEQRLYGFLGHSSCFSYRTKKGNIHIVGEKISNKEKEIISEFPFIESIIEAKLIRDHRHKAKINRLRTIEKRAKWLFNLTAT